VRVLHEVAADQIMRIAKPMRLNVIGCQQDTSIVDASGSQNIMAGLDSGAAPPGLGDAHRRDGAAVQFGLNAGRRRVSEHPHIFRLPQILTLANARPSDQSIKLPVRDTNLAGIEIRCIRVDLAVEALIERQLRQVQLSTRLVVPEIELLARNRPAAVRHPVAALKIDLVEQCNPPAPNGGGATEHPKARIAQRVVVETDAVALGQALRPRLMVDPATFQQDHGFVARQKPASNGDTGNPGAYDAQVGFDHRILWYFPEIDMHPHMLNRKRNGRISSAAQYVTVRNSRVHLDSPA